MPIIRFTENIELPLSEEERRRIQYSDIMRGVGYDIAHSDKIPEERV